MAKPHLHVIPVVDDQIRVSVSVYVTDIEVPAAARNTKRGGDGLEGSVRLAQGNYNVATAQVDDVHASVVIEVRHDWRSVRYGYRGLKRSAAGVNCDRLRTEVRLVLERIADIQIGFAITVEISGQKRGRGAAGGVARVGIRAEGEGPAAVSKKQPR